MAQSRTQYPNARLTPRQRRHRLDRLGSEPCRVQSLDLTRPHLQGDRRVAVVGGFVHRLGQHVVLGGGAVPEVSWVWWCEPGMTCIAELATSTSSIASQAETTLLGVSGQ